jgi:tetratricopeptide (TPR) repeat protein
LGYAALANADFSLLNWNVLPQTKLLSDGKAFAQTAVTLDPGLPEAFEARASAYQHEWDWEHARKDYLKALELKPAFALARRHYAVLLTQIGEIDEGVRQARQAMEDDPYDQSALPGYGLILYTAGRLDEAVRILEPMAKRNSMGALHNLGEAYALLGQRTAGKQRDEYYRKALEQAENVREIELRSRRGAGRTPDSDRMYAQFYAMENKPGAAEPYLRRLELELRAGTISPAIVAWVYAALGRKQEALDLLEHAVEVHDRHLLFTKVYPFLESLRQEPRFQKILSEMHL